MPTNIDELLAMEAKATPGPWFVHGPITNKKGEWVCDEFLACGDPDDERENYDLFDRDTENNMPFIAALRNAAPGLLAELQETRAALAAWMAAKEARAVFWRDHADDLVLHDSDEALALDDAIDAAEDVLMGDWGAKMTHLNRRKMQHHWPDVCRHCNESFSVITDMEYMEDFESGKSADDTMIHTCEYCGEDRSDEVYTGKPATPDIKIAYLYPNGGQYALIWHSMTSWGTHKYGPWRVTKRDWFISLPVFNKGQAHG